MFKLKQKLNLLALALMAPVSQVQARPSIETSSVNWGQIGSKGAVALAGAAVLYGAYKWWNRSSELGTAPGLPNAQVIQATPGVKSKVKDESIETKSVPTRGWFSKLALWRDDLPQIKEQLLAQKLSCWKDDNMQSGLDLTTAANKEDSTILDDFLKAFDIKGDDTTQLGNLKKRLQAEQVALKELSLRLANKIDKRAFHALNDYLASKKSAAEATVPSFSFYSLKPVDVFDMTNTIPTSKSGSWSEILQNLIEVDGGLFSALIAKNSVIYTNLIKVWVSTLVHYGRAKALEQLVDQRIQLVKATAEQESESKKAWIFELLAGRKLLIDAARIGAGVNASWFMINPDNMTILIGLFSKTLVAAGHTEET